MKYTLVALATTISGCAASNTARTEDYVHRPDLETKTSVVEQPLDPYHEALQSLREQGAVIDDTVQCTLVSRDYLQQDFNETKQRRDAEFVALEKILSVHEERVVGWYRSNEQRRLVTVKVDKEGNIAPVCAPAIIYAYTQVKSWEAYGGGARDDYFCVQASGPLDLVVTGTYDTLDAAVLAVRQAHNADVKRVELEMKERWKITKERLKHDTLDKVEIYRRKEEHRREERYQQQGTPAAPQDTPPKEQGQKTETPGEEPKGWYKQIREEIERRYEKSGREIQEQFERERKRIQEDNEKQRKEILGE